MAMLVKINITIINLTSILQYISKTLDFCINFYSVIPLSEFIIDVVKVIVTKRITVVLL